jgi:aromatic ring-opening dioxygenase LigB subunit
VSGLVFAAIAPHGGMCIAEACAPDVVERAARSRAAFEELGHRFRAARPEVVVVVTPHNVHVEGSMAVIVAGQMAGSLEGAASPVALRCSVDRDLAQELLRQLRGAGVPAVGVSFAGNDPETATMPMDWAVLIPLWFMGGRLDPSVPVVAMAPARDLPPEAHVVAGRAVAAAAMASGKRVALIASADHGHAHQEEGPYGFHPDAAVYDKRIVELVEADDLAALTRIDPALVANAKADSWWQMLVLHGAISAGWKGELLSYEAPTYFGMLCAAYAPDGSAQNA